MLKSRLGAFPKPTFLRTICFLIIVTIILAIQKYYPAENKSKVPVSHFMSKYLFVCLSLWCQVQNVSKSLDLTEVVASRLTLHSASSQMYSQNFNFCRNQARLYSDNKCVLYVKHFICLLYTDASWLTRETQFIERLERRVDFPGTRQHDFPRVSCSLSRCQSHRVLHESSSCSWCHTCRRQQALCRQGSGNFLSPFTATSSPQCLSSIRKRAAGILIT